MVKSEQFLAFHYIDILEITVESLRGQEQMRQRLLNDPRKTDAADAIMRLWTEEISSTIIKALQGTQENQRPVVVLYNLAALHPIGNPTSLMEFCPLKTSLAQSEDEFGAGFKVLVPVLAELHARLRGLGVDASSHWGTRH